MATGQEGQEYLRLYSIFHLGMLKCCVYNEMNFAIGQFKYAIYFFLEVRAKSSTSLVGLLQRLKVLTPKHSVQLLK